MKKNRLQHKKLNAEIDKIEKDWKTMDDAANKFNEQIDKENEEGEIITFDEIVRTATDAYSTLDGIDFAIMDSSIGERAKMLKMKCFELIEYSINELYAVTIEQNSKEPVV